MIVNTPANGVQFEYIDLTDFFTRFLLIAPAYGAMNKKFISINKLEPDTVVEPFICTSKNVNLDSIIERKIFML